MSIFSIVGSIFKKKKKHKNKLPTVKCNVRKFLSENDVIKELAPIKEKYSNLIFSDKAMVDSILSGFNLKIANDSLKALNKDSTKADLLPPIHWLSSRCHYLHNSRRAISAGITYGEWVCIQGFCEGGKNKPSHQKLNGKKFSLKDGIKYRGITYYPGVEEDCGCFYKPISPF